MKNLLKIISLVTLISLSGCKGNTSTNSSNSNVNSNGVSTNSSSSLHAPEGTIQYKVQVLLPNGEKAGEGLQVQWCDDTNCFSANTDANGVATTFLAPKEYDVHIYNYAETYACELGLKSNEDNASIEVKLQEILNYRGGTGSIEDPYVAHIGKKGTGMLLVPGMVFTIEPMINEGGRTIFQDSRNGWTIYTMDGKLSAQWEHTIVITEDGCEILTH